MKHLLCEHYHIWHSKIIFISFNCVETKLLVGQIYECNILYCSWCKDGKLQKIQIPQCTTPPTTPFGPPIGFPTFAPPIGGPPDLPNPPTPPVQKPSSPPPPPTTSAPGMHTSV